MTRQLKEIKEDEFDQVVGGAQPNQNAGGGPGNSGPGDKNSPVEGPPLVVITSKFLSGKPRPPSRRRGCYVHRLPP